jgi:hypothetical protein
MRMIIIIDNISIIIRIGIRTTPLEGKYMSGKMFTANIGSGQLI